VDKQGSVLLLDRMQRNGFAVLHPDWFSTQRPVETGQIMGKCGYLGCMRGGYGQPAVVGDSSESGGDAIQGLSPKSAPSTGPCPPAVWSRS